MMAADMSNARIAARGGSLYFLLACCFFGSAGTFQWLEAWTYLLINVSFSLSVIVWLKTHNPALLKERLTFMKRTAQPWDKTIMFVGIPFYLAMLIVPGLDAVRYQWSNVSSMIKIFGFIMTAAAFTVFFVVMRENTYLSRIVEIQKDHKVISTGPYRYVRHPMYVSANVLFICLPLSLGSVYGLIPALCMVIVILTRTYFEDRLLMAELDGYKEYSGKVRYRIFPGIW
jgi:protein-S-isoprenylcysteine O-methyltransferase Ste14